MAKKAKAKRAKAKKSKTRYPSPLRIELACGDHKKDEGYFGVDVAKRDGVDMVVDLEKFPWPFDDNSVSEIVCRHYIEHTKDIIKFMDEVYRILKPGSRFVLTAPYWTSIRAWQDPTHTRIISEESFLYFNKLWREANHLNYYPIKSDFDFTFGFEFYPEWVNRADEARNFAAKHYVNVIADIQVLLIKKVPTKKPKKKSS